MRKVTGTAHPLPPWRTSAMRLSSSPYSSSPPSSGRLAVFCSSRRAHKLNAQTSFASHLVDKLRKGDNKTNNLPSGKGQGGKGQGVGTRGG